MARSLGLTLCVCLCFWRTYCQVLQAPADLETYPDLNSYPLPANTGGTFTYPTKITQVYDEGVPMTIAWNTTYEHISLYIAYVHNLSISAPVDGAGNSQRQLQTNTLSEPSDTFSWVASCDPDCNSPYELHIVNSRGTSQEVTGEGFWSDYFWIRASSRPESDTSTTTSTSSTTSSETSTTSSGPSTTSSSATSVTTSSSAVPSTSSTTTSQAPLAASNSEPVSPSPSPAETESSGLSTGVIVGISIGAVAILLCAVSLGVFCGTMRRRREKVPQDMLPHGSYEGDKPGSPTYLAMTSHTHPRSASGQKFTTLDTIHPMNYSPTELDASHSPSELGPTR